jgi:uncharacterized membrane protein YqgA involved in biofilm formation
MGSISDGASQGIDQLILKSSLDFFASMAFASTLGWGVAASIIPLAIYQGSWTVIGYFAGNVLEPYQIDAMTNARKLKYEQAENKLIQANIKAKELS